MESRALPTLFGLALVSLLLLDTGTVWARAGSGGSRGSRSYSAPARPAPSPVTPTTPSSPSRQLSQPTASPQRPGLFGGLMGGIAGFALGGLLGSLLFGGLGGGFGGIGLFDILLVVGGGLLLMTFLRRRQAAPQPAYSGGASAYGSSEQDRSVGAGGGVATEAPAAPSDLERGVGYIRQMDPGFDPATLAQWAQRLFVDVQAAVTRRDMSPLNDRLTPQEFARLQGQCDQLRGGRRTSRVEQIQIKRAEVTEAWQESGQDWATVYFAASLADYTVDDTTGGLVDGSKIPQEIEEYWTFTRPVGPKPWRLSAIQTS